jgi:hypothetical protein
MNLFDKIKDLLTRYAALFMLGGFLISAALRLISLAHPGLSDLEAERALQALAWANGEPIKVGGEPGYVGLTSFLFYVFGASPFMARFWPALLGACLALVPWLYRKHLGTLPTLVLVYLVALNPGLVALSRSADGMMMAVTCLSAAIGFWLNRRPVIAGTLLGVAITSSPRFWPLFLSVAIAVLVLSRIRVHKDVFEDEVTLSPTTDQWVKAGLSALICLVLVSTLFFSHPNGISGVGSGVATYFSSWGQGGAVSRLNLLLILLAAELPLLGFGIWGLVDGLKHKQNLTRLLGIWYLSGLILHLVNPSADVWSLVLINLPLFPLTAIKLTDLFESIKVQNKIVLLVEIAAVISLTVFSMLNLLNLISFPEIDQILLRNRLIGVFLPLALLIAFTFLLAWGWDARSTRDGLVVGFGLILLGVLLGSAWKAAGWGKQAQNEFYANQPFITGDIAMLETVSDLSRWNTGVDNSIDISLSGLDSTSMRWALRDYEKVMETSVFPSEGAASIVVSTAESQMQSLAAYRGQLVVWAVEPEFALIKWTDWLKWGFTRSIPQKRNYVMLWARNDLFKGAPAEITSP